MKLDLHPIDPLSKLEGRGSTHADHALAFHRNLRLTYS